MSDDPLRPPATDDLFVIDELMDPGAAAHLVNDLTNELGGILANDSRLGSVMGSPDLEASSLPSAATADLARAREIVRMIGELGPVGSAATSELLMDLATTELRRGGWPSGARLELMRELTTLQGDAREALIATATSADVTNVQALAFDSTDDALRRRAAERLAELAEPGDETAYRHLIEHSQAEPVLRAVAVRALGGVGTPGAETVLRTHLGDAAQPDDVRDAAFLGLVDHLRPTELALSSAWQSATRRDATVDRLVELADDVDSLPPEERAAYSALVSKVGPRTDRRLRPRLLRAYLTAEQPGGTRLALDGIIPVLADDPRLSLSGWATDTAEIDALLRYAEEHQHTHPDLTAAVVDLAVAHSAPSTLQSLAELGEGPLRQALRHGAIDRMAEEAGRLFHDIEIADLEDVDPSIPHHERVADVIRTVIGRAGGIARSIEILDSVQTDGGDLTITEALRAAIVAHDEALATRMPPQVLDIMGATVARVARVAARSSEPSSVAVLAELADRAGSSAPAPRTAIALERRAEVLESAARTVAGNVEVRTALADPGSTETLHHWLRTGAAGGPDTPRYLDERVLRSIAETLQERGTSIEDALVALAGTHPNRARLATDIAVASGRRDVLDRIALDPSVDQVERVRAACPATTARITVDDPVATGRHEAVPTAGALVQASDPVGRLDVDEVGRSRRFGVEGIDGPALDGLTAGSPHDGTLGASGTLEERGNIEPQGL